MTVYMIGYDLHEGEDYEDLIDAIKELGTWWHHLDSTWLIESEKTAKEIRDELKQHITEKDELLVATIKTAGDGGGAAWQGFSDRASTWLKQHL